MLSTYYFWTASPPQVRVRQDGPDELPRGAPALARRQPSTTPHLLDAPWVPQMIDLSSYQAFSLACLAPYVMAVPVGRPHTATHCVRRWLSVRSPVHLVLPCWRCSLLD
jgi:hypothetical protein